MLTNFDKNKGRVIQALATDREGMMAVSLTEIYPDSDPSETLSLFSASSNRVSFVGVVVTSPTVLDRIYVSFSLFSLTSITIVEKSLEVSY